MSDDPPRPGASQPDTPGPSAPRPEAPETGFQAALRNATTELDVKRYEALARLASEEQGRRFPQNFLSPFGGAVIAGVVALAVAAAGAVSGRLMKEREIEAQSIAREEDHQLLLERDELAQVMAMLDAEIRTKGSQSGPLCAYFDLKILQSIRAAERLEAFLVRSGLCRLDGAGIAAFSAPAGKVDEARRQCAQSVVTVEDSCRAYDKSGFNSRPRASCGLALRAPEGKVFEPVAPNQNTDLRLPFTIVGERYRKISGPPLAQAMAVTASPDHPAYPVAMAGRISCTNDRGTGRTCEAAATITARAFDAACIALYEAR